TEPLLKAERGVWQHVGAEAVATLAVDRLQSRCREGLAGHLEREFRDEEPAQRIAGHVHALPEGGDAEQDAASACGELVQQACPPCLPLYEERPATAGAALAQRGRNVTQRAIRREQREQSAVARARHVLDHRADHFIEACTLVAAGDRQVRGDGQQRLLLKDRKSTRLNSSHVKISYAVFCLKKKKLQCSHMSLLLL